MIPPTTVSVHGAALREMRIRAGLGLDTFATDVGISRPYLSLLELGRRERVSPAIFARICARLGVVDRTALSRETVHIGTSEPAA